MVASADIGKKTQLQRGAQARDTQARDTGRDGEGGASGLLQAMAPARLTSRIIVINLIGLAILVAGILYFNQSRDNLIDARVESLMTQGSIMAAAVASSATVDTGTIVVDSNKLPDQDGNTPDLFDFERFEDRKFLIRAERSGPVLQKLVRSTGIRARIYDLEGFLVVDSNYYGAILRGTLPPIDAAEESVFMRWWRTLGGWFFVNDYPVQKEFGLDNGKDFPEVTAALNGAQVSVVRMNKKNEIIVSVAVPVQRFKAVLGALVLSTKGGEIDDVLRKERRIVFFTFLVALLVAVLLSIALAGHIAEPIRRLAASAERVRRGVNNRVEIPDFTQRRDEVGHLSGALRDMTGALYNRIDAIEAFAADVAHELKNPLTSLRSAVETLEYARTDEQRKRLVEIVNDDVKRLDRLITDISDASRLDAELAKAQAAPVDMAELLETFVNMMRHAGRKGACRVSLKVAPSASPTQTRRRAFMVMGHDTRLGQVVRNLLDNAVSFSPVDSEVTVTLKRSGRFVEFRVEDRGPGVPEGNTDKIFQRFYTDRPEGSFGKNSGLGLSISKQIVDAHRGTITAENIYGKSDALSEPPVLGARFTVRLPALPEDWKPS